ncbi:MAG: helicase-associated domain-containing protein [Myxococcales bacterium]|nr:helicase-associated domain-containing protein [Myxococcales bacterium]MCB9642993.1 helicase-associated domain-containing protein [Myxococcales bacterium]
MVTIRAENPLIVQSDLTLLVEVYSPRYTELREKLARFAELVRSPEHIHTYKISALSLWNAAATGLSTEEICDTITEFAKYPVPEHVYLEVRAQMDRYGMIRLHADQDGLRLEIDDPLVREQLRRHPKIAKLLHPHPQDNAFWIETLHRGEIKQALIKLGYPTRDEAGFTQGTPLKVGVRNVTVGGEPFALRPYQEESVEIFDAGGGPAGGHGVIVLPCGAGKTIVGIGALVRAQVQTLILATNISACRQWVREILDKTDLCEEDVGEYSGERKEIRPVTVATYQILTYRQDKHGDFPHFGLFHAQNWGLVIYDEVHLLPAPVFRMTSSLQACRRLGLTATLVREDGLEDDVFCLIGPKRFDMPWRELEQKGFIAEARCHEYRIELPREERLQYATATDRARIRIAAENPLKLELVRALCQQHEGDHILVIGQYIEQLREFSRSLDAPLITGQTRNERREKLYESFRSGETRLLVVSKVANFSIDLPDANVLMQISGSFGSRQEEAQRLGRILRPKDGAAYFYSLVSRDTCEQDFAMKRQRFLTEQGYQYQIREISSEDLETEAPKKAS